MKFLTYRFQGNEDAGVLSADGKQVYPLAAFGFEGMDMTTFVSRAGEQELGKIKSRLTPDMEGGIPLGQIELLAPIVRPKQDVVCLGINYAAHAEESARYKKEAFERNREYPVYFSKRVNRAVAHGEGIPSHRDIVERLDYEVELAVILGKDAYRVKKEEAQAYIFGYTILNDISAREVQTRHKQWYFGKSMEGFCPMGPWIVTKDEFSYPPLLHLSSKVNGELRQDSSTELLIFSIDHVIEELSQGMRLEAGTIISMGTPAGVGMGFEPPKFLKPGDVVECEIEGIGKLVNPVLP